MVALILATLLLSGGTPTTAPSPAASAPAAAIPDGTYTYQFRANGGTIGSTSITISRAGGAVKVHEVATLEKTYTVDSTVDPVTFVSRSLHAIYPTATPTTIDITFGS